MSLDKFSKLFVKSFYIELLQRFKKSTLWKRIVKNFSIGITGSAVNMGLGLAKTAILTKTISVENYGLLMIVVNFYAFFNMILDVKLNDLLFRFFPEFEQDDEKALEGLINLSLIICAIIVGISVITVLFFSKLIADFFYDNMKIAPLLVIYLIAGSLNVFQGFSTGILRLKNRFMHIVVPQVVGSSITVSGFLIYIFLTGKTDLYGLTVIMGIGSMVSFAVPFYFANKLLKEYRKGFGFIESLKGLQKHRGKLISVIVQTNIASYLKLGSERGGIFLLGVLGTPKQVALYNVAIQLVKPLKVLQSNVQPVVYPEIVKFYADKEYVQLKSLVMRITTSTFLTGLGLVLVSYFLVEPVLVLFTTSEYLEAVPAFMIIIITIFLSFATLCFYPLTVVMDRLKWRNLVVSIRFLYIGIVYFIGFTAVSVAGAQLVGSITTRMFNDYPIFKDLKAKIKD